MFQLFGPSNSLILLYDHLTHESAEEMESQIDEIGRYYKFVRLSELVRYDRRSRRCGVAVLAFKEARKSFFLLGAKRLQTRGLPFTLFLRPDCIGTNRLASEDEWDRKELGAQPLNQMDPTFFYATWGNILEAIAHQGEVGLSLSGEVPPAQIQADVTFIKKQTGQEVRSVFCPREGEGLEKLLRDSGMKARLSTREGIVEKTTPPFDLPVFHPERNDI